MRRRAVTYPRTPRREVFRYQLVGRATTNELPRKLDRLDYGKVRNGDPEPAGLCRLAMAFSLKRGCSQPVMGPVASPLTVILHRNFYVPCGRLGE